MDSSEFFCRNEILIINNALNEVLNGPDAIDSHEFHSRIGLRLYGVGFRLAQWLTYLHLRKELAQLMKQKMCLFANYNLAKS